MIETGEQILLVGEDREYFVTANEGQFSTDRGMIDRGALVGMSPGDEIRTHLGAPFTVLCPRSTAGVAGEGAKKALIETRGDIAEALLKLTQQ